MTTFKTFMTTTVQGLKTVLRTGVAVVPLAACQTNDFNAVGPVHVNPVVEEKQMRVKTALDDYRDCFETATRNIKHSKGPDKQINRLRIAQSIEGCENALPIEAQPYSQSMRAYNITVAGERYWSGGDTASVKRMRDLIRARLPRAKCEWGIGKYSCIDTLTCIINECRNPRNFNVPDGLKDEIRMLVKNDLR